MFKNLGQLYILSFKEAVKARINLNPLQTIRAALLNKFSLRKAVNFVYLPKAILGYFLRLLAKISLFKGNLLSLVSLAAIMLTHFIAIIVPGPDVFLILRVSLAHGFRYSFYACLGVCAGIVLWVFLTAFGLKALFEATPLIRYALALFSVCYLLFLSFLLFRSARSKKANKEQMQKEKNVSAKHFFILGMLTNISNPKAILYFASIFSKFIDESAPIKDIFLLIGAISVQSVFVFVLLGRLFAVKKAREAFLSRQKTLDGVCATIFALFALAIAYDSVSQILNKG